MNAVQASWKWSAPLHRSRCGASHQRRGVPCQDYSLSASLRSADGLSVGLMAVADGHGGSRYWLSDVGSRLACELAIKMASRDLASRPMAAADPSQLEVVRRWLASELPPRLIEAWQGAIQADWQQRQLPVEHEGEGFSSQTYGSTLALVVLTPQWWGHSGIGDWDLVLLSNHQADRIISQESDNGLQGEATESLCLTSAQRCFAARTAVYSLNGENRQAYGLVLTTDGIRKSCATDDDHLALSRYLLEEAQPHGQLAASESRHLDASLDRISREGSGDDVSVALACFGQLRAGVVRRETTYADPTLSKHVQLPQPVPPLPALANEDGLKARARRQLLVSLPVLVVLITAGALAASGVLLLRLWPKAQAPAATPPPQARLLSPAAQAGLRREIKRLCGEPELIDSSLRARRSQFRPRSADPAESARLLVTRDWLGGLIALSRPGGPGLGTLEPCPKLAAALGQHWQIPSTPTAPAAGSDDNGLRTVTDNPRGPGAAGASLWAIPGSANR